MTGKPLLGNTRIRERVHYVHVLDAFAQLLDHCGRAPRLVQLGAVTARAILAQLHSLRSRAAQRLELGGAMVSTRNPVARRVAGQAIRAEARVFDEVGSKLSSFPEPVPDQKGLVGLVGNGCVSTNP